MKGVGLESVGMGEHLNGEAYSTLRPSKGDL